MGHVIRKATPADVGAIVELLQKGSLQSDGVDKHVDNFIMIENALLNRCIGTAGLEIVEPGRGLLRSMAIESEDGQPKMVIGLIQAMIALAGKQHLQELYLLTKSVDLLTILGFEQICITAAPASIKLCQHVQQSSTPLSTLMVYKFTRE